MREAVGDLWTLPADVRVITTNGVVRKDGCLVMGRGVALQAAERYPKLPAILGKLVATRGNHVWLLSRHGLIGEMLASFPVKHGWFERADPGLISRSARELREVVDGYFVKRPVTIVVPRPGCGNGGLTWNMVRPILAPVWDDRFLVVTA